MHYTRATATAAPLPLPLPLPLPPPLQSSNTKELIHPNLTLSPGRARIAKVLDAVIARTVTITVTLGLTLGPGGRSRSQSRSRSRRASASASVSTKGELLPLTGVCVAVCGPVGLGDEVARAVGCVEPKRRDQVGGVEIIEE